MTRLAGIVLSLFLAVAICLRPKHDRPDSADVLAESAFT